MNGLAVASTRAADFRIRKLRAQICILVGLFLLAAGSVTARAVPEGADGISRLTRPLVLDGKMGDPAWMSATRYTNFKMRHPAPGQSPSERTEVYLAYNAATLYIAIRSFDDEPRKIRALATNGVEAWKDDWAVVCLNTYDDALNSLFFLVTPRNIRSSGALDNDNKPQLTVDMKWESRASIVADGWIAEMAIPFRILPFLGSERVTMSFKVARFISRKAEEENLPEMNPDQREHEHYRQIVLCNVVPSSVDASEVYRQGLENLRRKRVHLRDLGYEEQLRQWGDASVLDYLTFRSRELQASTNPFHFQRTPGDQKVEGLLAPMEYAPGKRIGNSDQFFTRSATTSFLVIKDDALINARSIDFAKFGRLMLNNGQWEGKQIVSQAWVEQATQPEEKPSSYYGDDPFFVSLGHYYKYFWWGDQRPGGMSDFHAVGNKGQYIYVSPQKRVIIVRNGFDFGIPSSRWARLFYQLADGL